VNTPFDHLLSLIFSLLMLYLYIILAVHAIFSLIPAVIAHSKGGVSSPGGAMLSACLSWRWCTR